MVIKFVQYLAWYKLTLLRVTFYYLIQSHFMVIKFVITVKYVIDNFNVWLRNILNTSKYHLIVTSFLNF